MLSKLKTIYLKSRISETQNEKLLRIVNEQQLANKSEVVRFLINHYKEKK